MSDTKHPKSEVLSADEVAALGGFPDTNGGISKVAALLANNPGAIKNKLNLTDEQTTNVKALVVGSGTAASVKWLSGAIGDELSAVLGAAASAYLAHKVFGSSKK
jgi:hypothetical protein